MTRSNTAIPFFLIAMFTSSGVAQAVDTVEEIKICAAITDQNARLVCFDNLGERVLREEHADRNPAQPKVRPESETETATNVEPLPDDLGSSKKVQYVGLITSCQKGHYGNWFFIFDNGQVWEDVNNRKLRFKECNFKATITRYALGYKMKIDGMDATIRVKRRR